MTLRRYRFGQNLDSKFYVRIYKKIKFEKSFKKTKIIAYDRF